MTCGYTIDDCATAAVSSTLRLCCVHVQRAKCTTDVLFPTADGLAVFSSYIRHVGYPDELPDTDARHSPLFGVVDGLPPMFFSWSLTEMLAEESEAMFDKLRTAGVRVEKSVHARAPHAYPMYDIPEAVAELALASNWLKQFVATP